MPASNFTQSLLAGEQLRGLSDKRRRTTKLGQLTDAAQKGGVGSEAFKKIV